MSTYSGPDLARSFRTVRKNTLQIAQEIPEDQYGFRAAPGTRSVAETLAHIAAVARSSYQLHGVAKVTAFTFEDFGKGMAEAKAYEASPTSKADIVRALEENGRQFGDWLETLDQAALDQVVSFPPPVEPPQKTRFEMLLSAKEHEMHHRAQLMLIERLLGIVPHLTREREARAAARQ